MRREEEKYKNDEIYKRDTYSMVGGFPFSVFSRPEGEVVPSPNISKRRLLVIGRPAVLHSFIHSPIQFVVPLPPSLIKGDFGGREGVGGMWNQACGTSANRS